MRASIDAQPEWCPAFPQALPARPAQHHTQTEDPARSIAKYTTLIAVALDYASIGLGSFVAYLLYTRLAGAHVDHQALKLFGFTTEYTLAFFLFGRINFIYRYDHTLLSVRNTASILRVSSFALLVLTLESFFGKLVMPRLLLAFSWSFITLFVLLQKHVTRIMIARLKVRQDRMGRVLIIGSGSEARRIYSFLLNSPNMQLKPVAFFEEQAAPTERVVYSHDYRFKDHAPVFGGNLDAHLLTRLKITDIFIAEPAISPQKIAEIAALTAEYGAKLSFLASTQPSISTGPINFQVMDGLVISSFASRADVSLGYRLTKRFLDIALSLAIMAFSFPLCLACALWVKFSSKGPVFFKQERIGLGGKPFHIYKFRSMFTTAPKYGRSPESHTDTRITSAGRFLRRTSLDELPQLINVLRGDMSLVGPRPEMPYIVSQYSSHQRQRLSVKQGLTGVWQLSADRRFAIHESIEYDMYYIENHGLFLDLAILLHTVAFAMKGI